MTTNPLRRHAEDLRDYIAQLEADLATERGRLAKLERWLLRGEWKAIVIDADGIICGGNRGSPTLAAAIDDIKEAPDAD